MKETTIKRIKSAINVLKHLLYTSDATELIEEQIANLEQVVENIGAKDRALSIARKAMDKASMMYFRDLMGIDNMIAEQDVLLEQALKGEE